MLRLYHNPRCSKSRAALVILEEEGHQPEVIRYLDNPPDEVMLRALVAKLARPAAELLRRNEPEFKTLGLARQDDIGDEDAIDALLTQPKLLQRPIIETDAQALVARPPERVRELL